MNNMTTMQRFAVVAIILLLLFGQGGGGKPTAATYFYNEDQNGVPSEVHTGLSKLNEQDITATAFEVEATTPDGKVPKQYAVSLPAAVKEGLPSLVVMAGDKVVRVVKSPTTEAEVLGAIK